MREFKAEKSVVITLTVLLTLGVIAIFTNFLLDRYSVPDKEERIENLILSTGTDKLSESGIANEISIALSRHTNWDNLFLSDNFKTKYKNRKNILDDTGHISNISSGLTWRDGNPVVLIFARKKTSLFDNDESDDITTEYSFKYTLNENGEIDDLILLEKNDIYTMSGDHVEQ